METVRKFVKLSPFLIFRESPMKKYVAGPILILLSVFLVSPAELPAQTQRRNRLPTACQKVASLFEKFPKPQPGDWQYEHPEEGQTFSQYLQCHPTTATRQRKTLYVQTLGRLSQSDAQVIATTCEYLGIFYGLPVKTLPEIPDTEVPPSSRRKNPNDGQLQFHAGHILEKLLPSRTPKDAAAHILFTSTDLWPGEDWNFVFGLATYRQRIGVWSIARNGDSSNPNEQTEFLRRTLRIAAHETGHMFTMAHCISYKCCMNGANSLTEADATPLEFCPECLAKLRTASKVELVPRWKKLETFYTENGLTAESSFVRKCLQAVEKK